MEKIEKEIKKEMEKISNNTHMFSLDIKDNNFQLLELKKNFIPIKNKKVLDIGCGKGRFLKHLVELGGICTGIDLSDNLIKGAKTNVKKASFIQGSATELPFKDNYFDYIYSIETFEHIPNIKLAIKEIFRVLKPNGKVIIIDKSFWSIHPIFLLPTPIRKIYLESKGKWIYSNSKIKFKERYFKISTLDNIANKYYKKSSSYKTKNYGLGPKTIKILKKYPIFHIIFFLTNLIYKLFPFTRFFIVWRWTK